MNDSPAPNRPDLNQTPLHGLHLALGARMVPFAGYEMPVQYPPGVLKEHLHTRDAAGLFDVSHMGQVVLRAHGGFEAAASALESLVPVDILALKPGRQRYGFFTDDDGGILDDLMIAHRGDHILLVVNAARKHDDIAHLRAGLAGIDVQPLEDRALLALQGPRAEAVLAELWPEAADLRFMDVREADLAGIAAVISRSGYTGEDGFEISLAAADAEAIARKLLDHPDTQPIGLGARDSLRLEAGLCLYGNDIDTTTSPVEAGLDWAIQKTRRTGGSRAGGFPGADRILNELEEGTTRRRVGLRPEGRAPVRAPAPLFATAEGGEPIGSVTSGGFSPTLEAPIAIGYLPSALSEPGGQVFAEVRGKFLPLSVQALPFVGTSYKK